MKEKIVFPGHFSSPGLGERGKGRPEIECRATGEGTRNCPPPESAGRERPAPSAQPADSRGAGPGRPARRPASPQSGRARGAALPAGRHRALHCSCAGAEAGVHAYVCTRVHARVCVHARRPAAAPQFARRRSPLGPSALHRTPPARRSMRVSTFPRRCWRICPVTMGAEGAERRSH